MKSNKALTYIKAELIYKKLGLNDSNAQSLMATHNLWLYKTFINCIDDYYELNKNKQIFKMFDIYFIKTTSFYLPSNINNINNKSEFIDMKEQSFYFCGYYKDLYSYIFRTYNDNYKFVSIYDKAIVSSDDDMLIYNTFVIKKSGNKELVTE